MVDLLMSKLERYPEADCTGCPLVAQKYVDGYVESDDLKDIEAIYIAEHPGQQEAQSGIPLSGQAGECLRMGVEGVGGNWQKSYRTNAVMCVPKYGEKLSKASISACRPRLEAELGRLARMSPDAKIVSLGKAAMQSIHAIAGLKLPTTITSVRGGTIKVPKMGRRVFFTYNPAYILRNHTAEPIFVDDLRTALHGKVYPYPKLANSQPEVRYCVFPSHAIDAIQSLATGPIAWDIETTSVIMFDQERHPKGRVTALAITDSVEYGYILSPEVLKTPSVRDAIIRLLSRPGMEFIAHNGKFDKLYMRQWMDLDYPVDFDTMLAHYVLDETTPQDLKWLSRHFLGTGDYDKEVKKYVYSKKNVKKMKFYDKVPFDVLSPYAVWDVCCTLALRNVFEAELKEQNLYNQPFLDPVMLASETLTHAEERGITIDKEHFAHHGATVKKEMAKLTVEMRKISNAPDLNPRSWVQVQPIMYDKFLFPKVSGKNFKPGSTSKDALKKIREVMRRRTNDPTWDHPFIELKLEYSRVSKMDSAYVRPLPTWANPTDGRVHTTFYIHGTKTGRLSSRDPALQVIPRPTDFWGRIIRSGFIAGQGMILGKVDHSQAELRTLAVESQDEYLLWCYNNGIDLHGAMGDRVLRITPQIDWRTQIVQPRSVAKIVNFGYAYDATPAGLAGTFPELITFPMAKKIHADYDQKWKGAAQWKKRTKAFAWKNGYVETCFGRRRRFPVVANDNKVDVGRQAVNFPIQSIASDLVLKAANNLHKEGVPIVLLVHDEIMFECPPDEAPDIMDMVANEMLGVAYDYSSDVVWAVDGSLRDRWAGRTEEEEIGYEKKEWSTESW